jgi:hypothetical protein
MVVGVGKGGQAPNDEGGAFMMRILCTLAFALMTGAVLAGCADDPSADRHRSGYSYENVEMGSPRSGQQYRFDERPPASNSDPYSRGRY